MRSSAEYTSTSVASHSCTFKAILSMCILIVISFSISAQDTITIKANPFTDDTIIIAEKNSRRVIVLDSNHNQFGNSIHVPLSIFDEFNTDPNHYLLTKKRIKKRINTIAAANIGGYTAVMFGLNAAWYANYPRSSFHTFNDSKEWLQVDKVGHMYSAYIESRASMEMWRWTGIGRKKRIWLGGLSGAVYQTVIETLDGFSAEWGWSWGDFGANVLGSGALIAQELAWNDQRIKLKFSFHKNTYADATLNTRADKLFGKTLAERFIKDYNAQTYWASANIKSFFPKSNLPEWLGVAVGYGANGMFGGFENKWEVIGPGGGTEIDRSDIKRYRQWYLAPDIDFSKFKTKKKGVKFLFSVLSAFKFPAPSIEFSQGKFKLHAIHF
ncbi:DUF2279 domain-containing protein [Ferruginibacter sp. SUN002]|uniref:DUF2279 domain-containing protein n=1 Tax=Ferruginibacter sp. SUN002 TaxID=2937789 RepID=UPI003D36B5D6